MTDSYRVKEKEIPNWLQKLGCFDIRDKNWRFSNLEIDWKPGFALKIYQGGDGPYYFGLYIRLIYPGFFIKTPFKSWKKYGDIFPSWGISFFDTSIHFCWGNKNKIWDIPFITPNFAYRETLLKNMSWYKWNRISRLGDKDFSKEYDFVEKNKATETYPYKYILKSGEIQETTATCSLQKYVHYYKWLEWLKWPKKEYLSIYISFKDEVGERAGSWKGGCLGCSWPIKPGQTIRSALKDMEGSRKF